MFRHHHTERLAELIQDITDEDHGGGDTKEALADLLGDQKVVGRLIEDVSPQARSALNELAWGPPSGRVPNARREVRAADAQSPIEQLLSRAPGRHRRGDRRPAPRGRPVPPRRPDSPGPLPVPPSLDGAGRDRGLADRTAAGQAFTFTRAVEELCERWSADPPGVLRSGGLAVRDLKRITALLDLPEWVAGLIIEVAHAAGLVAASGAVDGDWLPTPSTTPGG
ncbi:hypothetical protein ACFQX6_46545 [Streptosporangium lutulentum]